MADPRSEALGARIRTARESAGLSVRGLARRIGVSPSLLSQVERGLAQPSVGTLWALVTELSFSLDGLFAPAERPPAGDHSPAPDARAPRGGAEPALDERAPRGGAEPALDERAPRGGAEPAQDARAPRGGAEPARPALVQRADARPALELAGGVVWERLSAAPDPDADFAFVTYPPGADSGADDPPSSHRGKEYGFVISGRLEIEVGEQTLELGPGDAVVFGSETPHRFRALGDEAVTAVWLNLRV